MDLELSYLRTWLDCGQRVLRLRGRGIGLHQPWEQEGGRRNALGGVNAAAARAQKKQRGKADVPQHFPV